MWTENFQMFKLDLEKAKEPEIRFPTSAGSSKNQEFQKSIFFFDYAKVFDCVDHNKVWKILEEMEPKQIHHPAVDVTGDGSNIQCCKEQYCIGTWNVRFMNQGKLVVIKQEMARLNIDILGISELKWTGMDEFNSD